jgi:hypothetical protein
MSDADYVRRYCPVRAMTVRMCVHTDCKAFITIDHKDSRRGKQGSGEDSWCR